MVLTDTHAHLYAEEFNADRDQMLGYAIQNSVTRHFLPNIDESSIVPMLELCKRYPENCFPMMGLHPCSVNEGVEQQLAVVENYLRSNEIKFYGVGEVGVDLYWDKTFLKQQLYAFEKQIQWALEFDLPLIIHVRKAFNEAYDVVSSYNAKGLKGIFHCFSGSWEEAQRIMKLGTFKMGIGGVVTFKNAGLNEVVPKIPMEYLVLETDAPYLAPVPHRGKRNESSYLALVAKAVADLKNLPVATVADITTQNSKDIFRI